MAGALPGGNLALAPGSFPIGNVAQPNMSSAHSPYMHHSQTSLGHPDRHTVQKDDVLNRSQLDSKLSSASAPSSLDRGTSVQQTHKSPRLRSSSSSPDKEDFRILPSTLDLISKEQNRQIALLVDELDKARETNKKVGIFKK
jgi:hypothetical protein